ncbi:MAG: Uma2 family endonuclease [Marinoscillum sp.]
MLLENGYVLEFPDGLAFSNDEFFDFCQKNPELKIERDHFFNLIIMSPTGSLSGFFNGQILLKLGIWNESNKLGKVFDSSSGFILPDNSVRSPDVSWVSNQQWDKLTRVQKMKFAPVCPEFVVELKSPSDSLKELKEKMETYASNGVKLGWLIDLEAQAVHLYDSKGFIKLVEGFSNNLSGESVLPGFELDLKFLLEE